MGDGSRCLYNENRPPHSRARDSQKKEITDDGEPLFLFLLHTKEFLLIGDNQIHD